MVSLRHLSSSTLGGVGAASLASFEPWYLSDIDIMALTSHTEGFPNVVLESLCMHTPVLATDVGGTSEILKDGRTGVLIQPHQPTAIAAGLRRLLDSPDLASALATEGQRVVHQQFEFKARTEQECAIYTELVESRQHVARH